MGPGRSRVSDVSVSYFIRKHCKSHSILPCELLGGLSGEEARGVVRQLGVLTP